MELTARVAIAAANRPHPNETVSGDAWAMSWEGGVCRVALVDGAGHGPLAEAAARTAIAAFEEKSAASPAELLGFCHGRLRGTRGAVMAVVAIDPAAGTLELAGVGNIEARLLMNGLEQHPISQRGMLGSTMPTVRPFTTTLLPGWLLVLHSDGIRTRWNLAETAERALPAQELADDILHHYARADDDACVVVIRPAEARCD